ncbi:MAG: glycosyltransferase family 39 protein, partial [Anaerolineae bacterium]|nr:glycosyltransferase family 39 protein [Anaerolineae bacterium]
MTPRRQDVPTSGRRPDHLALILSALAILITGWIALNIFKGIPHLEDEFAYVWQAQVIARGELTTPSSDNPKSFLVPFVVDHNGQRFGKYPLGWPVMLSLGERLGLRAWVNPLLAGLGIWLTYRLGKKLLNERIGLLAAALLLSSPFFLMNSSTLLSHAWGLVLSAGFALFWLEALDEPDSARGWLPTLSAALTLGVLALSRPLTALGIALPFAIHGIILLWRGHQGIRRRVLTIGTFALFVGSLHLFWQYAVTGNALTNPYTLWWPYDKLGFGVGFGVTESGHNLKYAWSNTQFSLNAGLSDL